MSNYHSEHLEEFLINMQDADNYKPSNIETGMEYRNKNSVRQSNGKPYRLMCPINEFRKYDLAVLFFFRLVKVTAWIMIVLFMIHLPCIVVNYQGEGLNEYATIDMSVVSRLMRFSLANQKQLVHRELDLNDAEYLAVYWKKMLQITTDFVSTLILVGFTIYW